MKVCELTECIVNYHEIEIFDYDTGYVIYSGANVEAKRETQLTNKVLYICSDNKSKIYIGIKGEPRKNKWGNYGERENRTTIGTAYAIDY